MSESGRFPRLAQRVRSALQLSSEIFREFGELRPFLDEIDHPLTGEWAPTETRAKDLLRFGKRYAESSPEPVIRLVTDPEFRHSVTNDIRFLRGLRRFPGIRCRSS